MRANPLGSPAFWWSLVCVLPLGVLGQTPPADPPSSAPAKQPARDPILSFGDAVERYTRERALLHDLLDRVDVARSELAKVASDADKWLVSAPAILTPIAVDPSRDRVPFRELPFCTGFTANFEVAPWTTADEVRLWSKDLWHAEPLRERWLAIRRQDEEGLADRLRLPNDLAEVYREAMAIGNALPVPPKADIFRAPEYDRYHTHFVQLSAWASHADEFIRSSTKFREDLRVALEHRERAMQFLGCQPVSPVSPHTNPPTFCGHQLSDVRVTPGSGLGHDTEIARRHPYAMSDRNYFADDRRSGPTTWPVCDELYHAADNFDFWYRWATDERWYAGSKRRLDPAAWPRDAESTVQLHREFARVVRGEHRLLCSVAGLGYRELEEREAVFVKSWRTGTPIAVYTTLSLYFRPLGPGEEPSVRERIPPRKAPVPGRLLPPAESK